MPGNIPVPRHACRQRLLQWMDAGLAAVEPASRVAFALRDCPPHRTALLALGKAATGMAEGARSALGDGIVKALVVAPDPLAAPLPESWRFLAGNHPVPGAASLRAGRVMETWLRNLEPELPLLVLLSGGGSALAEIPVDGFTPANLRRMNDWLLASGLDIHHINAIRGRFSLLKRGGLLRLAGQRDLRGLLISDVSGDRIESVASGPLSPQPLDWPDVRLPGWLQELHVRLPGPKGNTAGRPRIDIVARNAHVLDEISRIALQEKIPCVMRESLAGAAEQAGRTISRRLIEGESGLYLFGGETSMRLPETPGRGGRNQHLALSAATEMAGIRNVHLLAFGTDGVDGNTDDAGALVDGGTVERILNAGLDPFACLAQANSGAALDAAGDVVHTGPTGTNVADVVVAWKTE